MREMKNSGIEWMGDIPETWKVARVKHGFVRKKEEAHQKNPVVLSLARTGVRVRDISNNEGQLAESYFNYNVVEEGDLLINPMDLYSGANCSISKVCGVISPAYINLRSKDGFNPEYYDYYFKIQYWLMAFFAHGKGVSFDNRWTLNSETLMNYPVIVPTYKEQCNIVYYLNTQCSKIDSIIEKQQKIIEKLKEYKLSIITETVTKGLNPDVEMKDSGYPWIGNIPVHWEVRKIKGFTNRINVGVVIRPSEYFDDKGTVPFLRGINVKEYELKPENMVYISKNSNEKLLKSQVYTNDILVVRDGAIGVSCVVPKQYEGANVVSMIIIGNDARFDSDFVCYCLNSLVGKTQFDITRIGSALTHTSVSAVADICVAFPDINEQRLISDYLNKMINKINKTVTNNERFITKLQEYKKSLIYEVVTGKKEI